MNRASPATSERTTRRRGAELDLSLAGVQRGHQAKTLAHLLRGRIVDGTLRPNADLPSSRQLAADLGVSRGVTVAAYQQLVAEGHLITEQGSGTSVAARTVDHHDPRPRIDIDAVAGMNPGQPDPALFPRRDWQRATHLALATLPDTAFAYGDVRGHLPLRTALTTYLGRTRGIVTDEDRIIVVNGFAQCLSLIANTLARRDGRATIAVEDPGSAGATAQLRWWGADLIPITVDDRGIDVSKLARTRARAVVVTPAHQYPTGVTLAPERRHALLAWADATGGIVIEDDYDAEYRYDREALTSLHALGPQHVIAAGSVSKSMSPSLRLGWMVVPDHLVVELVAAKANADLGSPILPQATLAEFIDNGALDRHRRRTRAHYRHRRDALIDGLNAAPHVDIAGIAAGLHVLLCLPPDADADKLTNTARSLGFAARSLARYRHHSGPPGVVLGYAHLQPAVIRSATVGLVQALGPSRARDPSS
jgi:GntR family transcriptional regulator / MocR family aminotransferase